MKLPIRPQRIMSAAVALAGLALAPGSVIEGHATTTWDCAAAIQWTVPNAITPTTSGSGFLNIGGGLLGGVVGAGICATTNENALPFVGAGTSSGVGYSLGYTYIGDCTAGVLLFSNGFVGTFSGGILVVAGVVNGEVQSLT